MDVPSLNDKDVSELEAYAVIYPNHCVPYCLIAIWDVHTISDIPDYPIAGHKSIKQKSLACPHRFDVQWGPKQMESSNNHGIMKYGIINHHKSS